MTTPRRRILWRTVVTYYAVYEAPKTGDRITIHALNKDMIPKHRTFRGAGGKRKYKRIHATATRRKVIIVAKSSKTRNKKQDVVDDELDELEELEDLDDLEDEDEEDDEPDDEEDEDEDEDDEDELNDLSVKELRAKAREDGHEPSAIRGQNKQGLIDLINEGVAEDDEDEEDDDEEEEAPPKRAKKSGSSKKTNKPSRNRQTDGTVGVQELAEATGKDGRSIRMYLRKNEVDKNEDTGRYEWPSVKNRDFLSLVKAIKGGASDRARKEQLQKLKDSKAKKTTGKKKSAGASRSKSSGTKRRSRS